MWVVSRLSINLREVARSALQVISSSASDRFASHLFGMHISILRHYVIKIFPPERCVCVCVVGLFFLHDFLGTWIAREWSRTQVGDWFLASRSVVSSHPSLVATDAAMPAKWTGQYREAKSAEPDQVRKAGQYYVFIALQSKWWSRRRGPDHRRILYALARSFGVRLN